MTPNLWVRIRKLFGKRSPSRQLDHILAGWRPDDPATDSRLGQQRERLDLIEGWVAENPEHASNDVKSRRGVRKPAHRGHR